MHKQWNPVKFQETGETPLIYIVTQIYGVADKVSIDPLIHFS